MRYKSTSTNNPEGREFTEGYESEYESDGETKYYPEKFLGAGQFAKARLFRSTDDKKVAVLNPVKIPGDKCEARTKHQFFQTVYPQHQSHLFSIDDDYRLVVPYIEYTSFAELAIDTPEQQRLLLRSAAQTLQDCHNKGMILIDLKADNIYYDGNTQQSYLIDGGFSVPIGSSVDPWTFRKNTQTIVDECKITYTQIAPECWSVRPVKVLARPAMDIYALGNMMRNLLKDKDQDGDMQLLIARCLESDPQNRPTPLELITSLDSYIHLEIEADLNTPAASIR